MHTSSVMAGYQCLALLKQTAVSLSSYLKCMKIGITLQANDRTKAKRMLLNKVEMLSFLIICHELCWNARVVSLQLSGRVKENWRQQCSFSSVSSNSSAWYQSLKCLAVVLLWKHNTAKINSFTLQRKDRKINTGSKTATTFFSTLKKKIAARNGNSLTGERDRDAISWSWNNQGLQFYLLQEEISYFNSST